MYAWKDVSSTGPDPARGVDEQLELAALVVPREEVAARGRGEPALRAQREALDRHVPARLLDPAQELVLRLELRRLRRDQPEGDGLPARREAERLATPGSIPVGLQAEAGRPQAA